MIRNLFQVSAMPALGLGSSRSFPLVPKGEAPKLGVRMTAKTSAHLRQQGRDHQSHAIGTDESVHGTPHGTPGQAGQVPLQFSNPITIRYSPLTTNHRLLARAARIKTPMGSVS